MLTLKRNIPIYQIFWHQYVAVVIFFIIFLYYESIFSILLPKIKQQDEYVIPIILMAIINFLTFLVVWALIQTMITDPGRVPQYWGFFLDDPEHKKKRYCLICHIFKPERCHHCSQCNRCVLNMDHHCPWINNCVGFSNRKFFLLLIIYATLELFLVNLLYIYHFITLFQNDKLLSFLNAPFYLTFLIIFPMQGVFCNFLKFHIKMVLKNETTIENMEKIRDNQDLNAESRFNMGNIQNWRQVFGNSKVLWFFPTYGENGFPDGDGVMWQMKPITTTEFQHEDGDNTTNTQNNTLQQNNGQASYTKIYQNLDQQNQASNNNPSSRLNNNLDSQRQSQRQQQQSQRNKVGSSRNEKLDTENVYTFNTTIKNETGIQSNLAKLDGYNPNSFNNSYSNQNIKISSNTTAMIEEEQ